MRFLRKTLVVFQFVVSVILISGTIIVYRQIDFMRSAKLGFADEQIIVIPGQRSSLLPKYESFKDLLLLNSSITNVTGAHAIVGRDYQTDSYKKEGQDDFTSYPALFVRNDFLQTMGVKLLAGHDFARDFTDPGYKAIINRTMMETLGWKNPEDAIGQVLDGLHQTKSNDRRRDGQFPLCFPETGSGTFDHGSGGVRYRCEFCPGEGKISAIARND